MQSTARDRGYGVAGLRASVSRAIRTLALSGAMLGMASCGSDTPTGGLVEPVPNGSISLGLTPTSVALAAGGTGSVGLTVTRTGFDGPVTLSASGVPAGVSVTFGSATVAAGASSTSVNVVASTAIPAPSVEISITGTGSGLMSPAVKLTLRPL